jgi:hypothetical protein
MLHEPCQDKRHLGHAQLLADTDALTASERRELCTSDAVRPTIRVPIPAFWALAVELKNVADKEMPRWLQV